MNDKHREVLFMKQYKLAVVGATGVVGQTARDVVEQFGFAIIPLLLAISSGFTSGTTNGTSGSIRQALLLSTTTQSMKHAKS